MNNHLNPFGSLGEKKHYILKGKRKMLNKKMKIIKRQRKIEVKRPRMVYDYPIVK